MDRNSRAQTLSEYTAYTRCRRWRHIHRVSIYCILKQVNIAHACASATIMPLGVFGVGLCPFPLKSPVGDTHTSMGVLGQLLQAIHPHVTQVWAGFVSSAQSSIHTQWILESTRVAPCRRGEGPGWNLRLTCLLLSLHFSMQRGSLQPNIKWLHLQVWGHTSL